MTIIQTTARVPDQYRDLMLSVCARLRDDDTFGPKLIEFMQGAPAPSALLASAADIEQLRERMARLEKHVDEVFAGITGAFERENARRAAVPAAEPAGKPTKPARPKQLDIEDAIKGDKPASKAPRKKAPATADQKAERKAFGNELRAAPILAGKGWTEQATILVEKTGMALNTVKNILSGSIASGAETRAKLRAAAGL